ncbi:mediator of RNA polymerase II transcription subunit 29-like [Mizuhopecten yessoensis]|uniref:Mediator of RNA polymerase II transcription subunit 29 n=1 Tax=Mizuhopecten yessoensis TaxID=6573 RepID=A0A210QNV5_MIZYE|nr:mediator of RNA polymerase II transcription subunit 29-like [Mizuhopecten yessoensis]OWF50412.1 Mediator of RNA polymerase II transcription subunit 29 [Mizuhopecten yessoensis]
MAASADHRNPPSQQQQQQLTDSDPVHRVKFLMPRLKESLANLIKVAGQSLRQNALTDDGLRPADSQQLKFEKSLEEFYSLCDQIESNLRLALEIHQQNTDSQKFIPFTVNVPKENNQWPETPSAVPYTQFISMVRQQISCAKEIHDLLMECSKKISD